MLLLPRSRDLILLLLLSSESSVSAVDRIKIGKRRSSGRPQKQERASPIQWSSSKLRPVSGLCPPAHGKRDSVLCQVRSPAGYGERQGRVEASGRLEIEAGTASERGVGGVRRLHPSLIFLKPRNSLLT